MRSEVLDGVPLVVAADTLAVLTGCCNATVGAADVERPTIPRAGDSDDAVQRRTPFHGGVIRSAMLLFQFASRMPRSLKSAFPS